jgi:3-phosphoshikimate 1-carboxyvinyltransferase
VKRLRVSGEVRVPGDKSITHRALLLAAAAAGESRLRGALAAADCRSTARVLRQLGCPLPQLPADGGELRIDGRGWRSWRTPESALDCGNSGTTARLLLGALAGAGIEAALTGDASLRGRPMRRVTDPLAAMGARVTELGAPDRLPVEIAGGELRPAEHRSPVASAQVKSALLLAGLLGGVGVTVHEPRLSRDHTERLLRGLGVPLRSSRNGDGWTVELPAGEPALPPLDLDIPGDISSAAFFVALALLAGSGELRLPGVGTNPTRTGFLAAVERMGGQVVVDSREQAGGEPIADLVARGGSTLRGIAIGAGETVSLIDEIPVLAVLAARAEGETRITGARELRVKETDRIGALVSGLRAVGTAAEELEDGLTVRGSDRPLRGSVTTHGDHRIAMAFAVLAALPENRIEIDAPECAEVSFPGFREALAGVVSGDVT